MKLVRLIASCAVLSSVTLAACSSDLTTPTDVGDEATLAVSGTTDLNVGSVVVTPATATVALGSSVTLTAVVKDQNGNPMRGRSITWTSSDRAIARVSSDGVVSGRSLGKVTITAMSSGKSGTAVVTVGSGGSVGGTSTPAPSPDPTPVPSPAPGNALAFGDGFEGGAAALAGGYGWASTLNVSTDVARSGKYSLRMTYKGNPDLCADATAEKRFKLGEDLREVWFEYYLYLPSGSEGLGPRFEHRQPKCAAKNDATGVANNNKFFALWATKYSTEGDVQVITEYTRVDDNTSKPRAYSMNADGRSMQRTGTVHANLLEANSRGRWTRIRIHAKTSSAQGARDGVYQVWRDDTLVWSVSGFDIYYPGGNNFFRNGYLMGWANSGFTQDTNIYIDDFKIFRSNPGW